MSLLAVCLIHSKFTSSEQLDFFSPFHIPDSFPHPAVICVLHTYESIQIYIYIHTESIYRK